MPRATLLLLKICLRGEVLRASLIVISLPLTLSSIYIFGSSAVLEDLSSVVLLNPVPLNECLRVRVVYSSAQGVSAPVYFVENISSFLRYYSCKVTLVGTGDALVSTDIWGNLSGEEISTSARVLKVAGFVDCSHLRGSFIIAKASDEGGWLVLCPEASMQLVVEDLGRSFSDVMLLLSFLSLLSFAVASPLFISKMVDSLSREMCVLRGQGLGIGELRASLFLSLSSVVLISSIYGVSFGVVLAHGALWILRFFGPSVLSRPLPLFLLIPTSIYCAFSILVALLVSYVKVGSVESSC